GREADTGRGTLRWRQRLQRSEASERCAGRHGEGVLREDEIFLYRIDEQRQSARALAADDHVVLTGDVVMAKSAVAEEVGREQQLTIRTGASGAQRYRPGEQRQCPTFAAAETVAEQRRALAAPTPAGRGSAGHRERGRQRDTAGGARGKYVIAVDPAPAGDIDAAVSPENDVAAGTQGNAAAVDYQRSCSRH